jgi:hypothetical protein
MCYDIHQNFRGRQFVPVQCFTVRCRILAVLREDLNIVRRIIQVDVNLAIFCVCQRMSMNMKLAHYKSVNNLPPSYLFSAAQA